MVQQLSLKISLKILKNYSLNKKNGIHNLDAIFYD